MLFPHIFSHNWKLTMKTNFKTNLKTNLKTKLKKLTLKLCMRNYTCETMRAYSVRAWAVAIHDLKILYHKTLLSQAINPSNPRSKKRPEKRPEKNKKTPQA